MKRIVVQCNVPFYMLCTKFERMCRDYLSERGYGSDMKVMSDDKPFERDKNGIRRVLRILCDGAEYVFVSKRYSAPDGDNNNETL